MEEFLTAFLFVVALTLTSVAYINNRTQSKHKGGFIFSPIPFILVNYALIYLYRPFVILHHDAATLNYVQIDFVRAQQAVQLGLLSLCAVLLPYLINHHNPPLQRCRPQCAPYNIHVNRLYLLYFLFSVMVVSCLFFYGSALNNTGDRIANPSAYKGYFLFIVAQRFHFVLSILALYYHFSSGPRHITHPALLFFLLFSTILTLLAAGRAAAFYLLIASGIIFVFTNAVRITWKHIAYIGFVGIIFSLLNFIFSIVRVVISSTGWEWGDLINAVDFSESAGHIEDLFVLASWDYSVFDTFVTIYNELDQYTFGATNIQYFLSYVPRVIWPEKPYDQGFQLYLTNKFYGDVFSSTGSTFQGTIAGEGYLNFGVIGVIFYSLFFSLVLYNIYKKAIQHEDPYYIILYAIFYPFSQQVIRGGLDVMANFVLLMLIPLWLINIVIRKTTRNLREDTCRIKAAVR